MTNGVKGLIPGQSCRGFVRSAVYSICVFTFLTLIPEISSASSRYAAMVIDGNTGKVIHAVNADKHRYPASLTKMMTLYMVFRELKKGTIAFDTKFTVTGHAAAQAPSKLGLKPGDKITVINAIRALVTKSANDVAATVGDNLATSEAEFAAQMTKVAHELGMKSTTFKNASGLPDASQRTTARDMITLSQHLFDDFPQYFHLFKTKFFTYSGKTYRNHNRLLFGLQGVEGIKTGYTRASGFNLTTSYRRGKKHLIAVVMGGTSASKRNAQMSYLLRTSLPKASATVRKPKQKKPEVPAKVAEKAPVAEEKPVVVARLEPTIEIVKVKSVDILAHNQPVQNQPQIQESNRVEQVSEGSVEENGKADTPEKTEVKAEPVEDRSVTSTHKADGPFHIQVGAFSDMANAQNRLDTVTSKAGNILDGHPAVALPFDRDEGKIVRARFAAFSEDKARTTCRRLKKRSINCIVLRAAE